MTCYGIRYAQPHRRDTSALDTPLNQLRNTFDAEVGEKFCSMIGTKDFLVFLARRKVLRVVKRHRCHLKWQLLLTLNITNTKVWEIRNHLSSSVEPYYPS